MRTEDLLFCAATLLLGVLIFSVLLSKHFLCKVVKRKRQERENMLQYNKLNENRAGDH